MSQEEQQSTSAMDIAAVIDSIKDMLITKNKLYGDSALNPAQIFCRELRAADQILVRLDDKLKRIKNRPEDSLIRKNDVSDIIGYLILYCVSRDWKDFSDQID